MAYIQHRCMRKNNKKNFDIYSSFSWFTPGWKGIIMLTLWFLVGVLLGNVVNVIFVFALGQEAATEYGMVVSYLMMFIPPMMYASYKSKTNSLFDEGYALDSNNFGSKGGLVLSLLAIISTLALGYVLELFCTFLPEMPDWLKDTFEQLTGGNFWLNFLCVSIFAPFFEEWLCRGEVLRGLLNFKKKDGSTGIKPIWAIVASAAFFAIIHANPWQAVVAFGTGCMFGYVYYKTGSLKLTMLMHFTNNTFALICGHIDALAEMDTWKDVIPGSLYWIIYAACVLLLILTIKEFSKISTRSSAGNCDRIAIVEE